MGVSARVSLLSMHLQKAVQERARKGVFTNSEDVERSRRHSQYGLGS